VVRSEENGEMLLESKILLGDIYQRQQGSGAFWFIRLAMALPCWLISLDPEIDTLIVWTEPDGLDLALSFQEPSGCTEVW